MADQKISELPAAISTVGADLLNIVQGGSNKKITVANFFSNVKTPVVLNVDGGDQDQRIKGLSDDDLVFVDASTDRVGFGTETPVEKVDVNGNLAVSGGFLRFSATPEGIAGVGTLVANVTSAVTTLNGAGAVALSIGDGVDGQMKTIVIVGAASTITLSGLNVRFTSAVTSSVGSSITLQWIDGKWNAISAVGFVINL